MTLTRPQLKQFLDLVVKHYTPDDLWLMTRLTFDGLGDGVAWNQPPEKLVFHLIEAAERQGLLRELVAVVQKERPGVYAIQQFCAALLLERKPPPGLPELLRTFRGTFPRRANRPKEVAVLAAFCSAMVLVLFGFVTALFVVLDIPVDRRIAGVPVSLVCSGLASLAITGYVTWDVRRDERKSAERRAATRAHCLQELTNPEYAEWVGQLVHAHGGVWLVEIPEVVDRVLAGLSPSPAAGPDASPPPPVSG